MIRLIDKILEQLPIDSRVIHGRIVEIDVARGLAICLVVVGHVVARQMPLGNEWYEVLKACIYRFHMPLFMALAGVSFAISAPNFDSLRSVAKYSGKKIKRLLVPYVVIGFIIVLGKIILSPHLHVDNVPDGFVVGIYELIFLPAQSAAGFLWFIYVLAVFYALVPIIFIYSGRRPVLLLLLGLVLSPFEYTNLFMIDRVVEYLPFFAVGAILPLYRRYWSQFSSESAAMLLVGFFLLLIVAEYYASVPKWVTGFASIPAAIALSSCMNSRACNFFDKIGRRSMSIYLFNTISIGLTKAMLFKFIFWNGAMFLFFFPVLLVSGVLLPLALKELASRRAWWIDRYI